MQADFRGEENVNRSFDRLMMRSFRDVYEAAVCEKCTLRMATQILAVCRVAKEAI